MVTKVSAPAISARSAPKPTTFANQFKADIERDRALLPSKDFGKLAPMQPEAKRGFGITTGAVKTVLDYAAKAGKGSDAGVLAAKKQFEFLQKACEGATKTLEAKPKGRSWGAEPIASTPAGLTALSTLRTAAKAQAQLAADLATHVSYVGTPLPKWEPQGNPFAQEPSVQARYANRGSLPR